MIEPAIYDNERRYIFNNYTAEDFIGMYAGVPTLVKSGETIELPMYKAYLFTKHLVDREMIKDSKESSMASQEARQPYEDKIVAEITAGVDSPVVASIKEKIRKEIEEETVKKSKAPKKEKDVPEETGEFADIKD